MNDRNNTTENKPIDLILEPVLRFMHVESSGGIVLFIAMLIALFWANSVFAESYSAMWKTKIGFVLGPIHFTHSLKHWIADGLMAIFFFVVGLEVKRELVMGELQDLKSALLPVAAALGGMIIPAAIYLFILDGKPGVEGWGIPMATDIAFVVGILAILGNRIPKTLRVFLLSLAIADDIGAILVIAIGYTETIHLNPLIMAAIGLGVIFLFKKAGIRSLLTYTVLGIIVWLGFHESGIHATIAGVILGLMTPATSTISSGQFSKILQKAGAIFRGEEWKNTGNKAEKVRILENATRETVSPLEYLENAIHPWSGFFIMPVFALANAGVQINLEAVTSPLAMAITGGLVLGKPLGIVFASWIAVRLYLKKLPEGLTWRLIIGGGFLAGIGFTMALFIADLALPVHLVDGAKVGILFASFLAALLGVLILLKRTKT